MDGSTDGTAEQLEAMAQDDDGLRVLRLAHNSGKGAAVLHALDMAAAEGFTHALTMDSDGQHPAHLKDNAQRATDGRKIQSVLCARYGHDTGTIAAVV